MQLSDHLVPPVVEEHEGIVVVREDLCCPGLASGKLRGLIPWFSELRQMGRVGVINHAVSYSNSHAIVGYAARACGLAAVSYANVTRPTPQTRLAESLGVRMVYSGPKQLGPLRAHAMKHREEGFRQLPWALCHPDPYRHIAANAVAVMRSIGEVDAHVVPVGGGGYVWAVAEAVAEVGYSSSPDVYGVITSGTKEANTKRMTAFPPPRRKVSLVCFDSDLRLETPFPSDPNYEHYAWPFALRLMREFGKRVCFWSVGCPLVLEK